MPKARDEDSCLRNEMGRGEKHDQIKKFKGKQPRLLLQEAKSDASLEVRLEVKRRGSLSEEEFRF